MTPYIMYLPQLILLNLMILTPLVHPNFEPNCDETCYGEVEQKLHNLDFHPPDVDTFPSAYEELEEIIRLLEEITAKINDLTYEFIKITTLQERINDHEVTIEKLYKLLSQLNEINDDYQNLLRMKEEHENTVKQCEEANAEFTKLKDDFNEIEEKIHHLNDTLGKYNEIEEWSEQIQKELNDIRIPDSLYETYVCDSDLTETFQDIFAIADTLTHVLQSIQDNILDEIHKLNEQNAKDIADITSLDSSYPEPLFHMTKETQDLLNLLKDTVKDLLEKLEKLHIDEDIIKENEHVNEEILQEFEKILQTIFSEENISRVQKELDKAKKTLQNLELLEELKEELKDMEDIVNHLDSEKVCEISDYDVEL